jgi:hypothetical protein
MYKNLLTKSLLIALFATMTIPTFARAEKSLVADYTLNTNLNQTITLHFFSYGHPNVSEFVQVMELTKSALAKITSNNVETPYPHLFIGITDTNTSEKKINSSLNVNYIYLRTDVEQLAIERELLSLFAGKATPSPYTLYQADSVSPEEFFAILKTVEEAYKNVLNANLVLDTTITAIYVCTKCKKAGAWSTSDALYIANNATYDDVERLLMQFASSK